MSDASEEPVAAELVQLPQPPLSIAHLMLWILGSAAVLGSFRWVAEPQQDDASLLLFQLDQLVRSVTLGAGAAAILVYARRLVRRDAPLPRHPGHWLLVVQGLNWPAYFILNLFVFGVRSAPIYNPHEWDSFWRAIVGRFLYYLWGAALFLGVRIGLREAQRWRIFFAVGGTLALLHSTAWCCVLGDPFWSVPESSFVLVRIAAALGLLAVCVQRDRAAGIRRDWMHAAGAGLYVLGNLWNLVVYLIYAFSPRQ